MNSNKAEDCRAMIDYLLGLVHEGKLKYEYVKCSRLIQLLLLYAGYRCPRIRYKKTSEYFFLKHICRMEVSPLSEFSLALEKAMGKHGSHPKQVIRF